MRGTGRCAAGGGGGALLGIVNRIERLRMQHIEMRAVFTEGGSRHYFRSRCGERCQGHWRGPNLSTRWSQWELRSQLGMARSGAVTRDDGSSLRLQTRGSHTLTQRIAAERVVLLFDETFGRRFPDNITNIPHHAEWRGVAQSV